MQIHLRFSAQCADIAHFGKSGPDIFHGFGVSLVERTAIFRLGIAYLSARAEMSACSMGVVLVATDVRFQGFPCRLGLRGWHHWKVDVRPVHQRDAPVSHRAVGIGLRGAPKLLLRRIMSEAVGPGQPAIESALGFRDFDVTGK